MSPTPNAVRPELVEEPGRSFDKLRTSGVWTVSEIDLTRYLKHGDGIVFGQACEDAQEGPLAFSQTRKPLWCGR